MQQELPLKGKAQALAPVCESSPWEEEEEKAERVVAAGKCTASFLPLRQGSLCDRRVSLCIPGSRHCKYLRCVHVSLPVCLPACLCID